MDEKRDKEITAFLDQMREGKTVIRHYTLENISKGITAVAVVLFGLYVAGAFSSVATAALSLFVCVYVCWVAGQRVTSAKEYASRNPGKVDRSMQYLICFFVVFGISWLAALMLESQDHTKSGYHFRFFAGMIIPALLGVRLALGKPTKEKEANNDEIF